MPESCLLYTLRPDKSVCEEIVRVLTEIAARGQSLAAIPGEPGEAQIHEGRLLIKRLRALMWFARPALDPKIHAKVQANLRAAAGLLAGPRDIVATRSTLEKLRDKVDRKRDEEHIRQVVSPFAGAGEDGVPIVKFREAMDVVSSSVGELAQAARAGDEWPSPRKRVEKASHAARKAAHQANESKSDVDFHTWRKKAKRLLYLLELTQPHPTRHMDHLIARVEKLQDQLGLYHDQVVTEDRLRTQKSPHSSTRRVLHMLARSKKRLGKKARKIERKVGRSI